MAQRVSSSVVRMACAILMVAVLEVVASGHSDFDFNAMESQIQATVAKSMPAVVACTIKGRPGGFSAVIVSKDGYVLTAAHCVAIGGKAKKTKYTVHLADGRKTEAEALGFSRTLDCALMKITKKGNWPVAEMGDSSQLVKNQPCVVISHPEGHNPNRGAVVRFGRIKATITPVAGMIQSTCLMEPGDSGGPVFDLDGRVIGINSQIRSDLTRNYQVSINTFKQYWEKLKKPGTFTPSGTPGVPTIIHMKNTRQGIEVAKVDADSIAGRAGLKKGDKISRINNLRVTTSRQFTTQYIKLFRTGAGEIPVTVKSGDDEPRVVVLKLPKRKKRTGVAVAELENLIEQVAELEEELDDATVLVTSRQVSRPMSVFGTVISSDGLLLSKNSQVGDDAIFVKLRTGKRIPVEVVSRDEETDLVLLQCNELSGGKYVALGDTEEGEADELPLGRMLLSPTSRGPGCVSVIGSKVFGSAVGRTNVPKSFLGVGWNETAKPVKLTRIVPNSPADKAGLKVGDVILKVNDTIVKTSADVRKVLRPLEPGAFIILSLTRNGSEIGKRIKVGKRPNVQVKRHAADFLVGGKSERRTGFKSVFTHDATLQQKECGTPVFDVHGEFVGLNIARHSRAMCYAVPASVVREFVESNLAPSE